MVDKGEGCDILYLDYSKVLNTVPHERLLKTGGSSGYYWKDSALDW